MKKQNTSRLDTAIVDVFKREDGVFPTRNFANRYAASQDIFLHLDLLRKLEKHSGCVNTVSFNKDGDILMSGSDDRKIILWDWKTGHSKLSFDSGHMNNVLHAKFMPLTNDRSIATCGADGLIRHAQIKECGQVETTLLGKHRARAHKLAIEPGSPYIFYTCGEDGLVQHVDLRAEVATKLFTCIPIKDIAYFPVVLLNAIAIDPRNPNFFAVAGSDEYARLYDIRMNKWNCSTDFGRPVDFFRPPRLVGEDGGITGLAFSEQRELLVSYVDEFIYLFTKEMGLGADPLIASSASMDDEKSERVLDDQEVGPQVYKGHRNHHTVKGVNFVGPNCEYIVSGSDCGRMFIWNKNSGELIRAMEADKHVVNCIESHPYSTGLASSGIDHDIKIWTPNAIERATLPTNIETVTYDRIRFCSRGSFEEHSDVSEEDDDDNDDESEEGSSDVSSSIFCEDYCDEDDDDNLSACNTTSIENDDCSDTDDDNSSYGEFRYGPENDYYDGAATASAFGDDENGAAAATFNDYDHGFDIQMDDDDEDGNNSL